ncbi:hypothetical protein ACWEOE_40230 [Amycolatopsis sp. NPDC004368]
MGIFIGEDGTPGPVRPLGRNRLPGRRRLESRGGVMRTRGLREGNQLVGATAIHRGDA